MKAVLRVNFIAGSVLVKKLETSFTNNLTEHLRLLEQKETNSPKINRRQDADFCQQLCWGWEPNPGPLQGQ